MSDSAQIAASRNRGLGVPRLSAAGPQPVVGVASLHRSVGGERFAVAMTSAPTSGRAPERFELRDDGGDAVSDRGVGDAERRRDLDW